ncbi:hypothetical protein [Streptomyces sp. TS71-3]|uniref:hypothetical protein n=1 Tax=Streptomyces sp. TS71-3 TaxID=2733862 RepID=UPI001B14E810|nr:hypothetical protein [Streptomyces sp. TS71-3]GHJ36518.1 hypothetical protein Sm713_21270 [Streptomyces sp. TS71-3]
MSAVVIAVVAAVSSVVAAAVAGVFALAARRLDARVQRLDKVQERISERKYGMYEPVVELLGRMFTTDELPTPEEKEHKRRFDNWVIVYGSPGTVRAYSRLMQALPHHPPGDIQIRLYADFLLAVREDIGDPVGTLDRVEILGTRQVRLSDTASLTDPDLDAVCTRLGWPPPWRSGR